MHVHVHTLMHTFIYMHIDTSHAFTYTHRDNFVILGKRVPQSKLSRVKTT